MAWIGRHRIALAAALLLALAGAWLALAEHHVGIGWVLIVWALAIVAGCAGPAAGARTGTRTAARTRTRPTARRGRGGLRSG